MNKYTKNPIKAGCLSLRLHFPPSDLNFLNPVVVLGRFVSRVYVSLFSPPFLLSLSSDIKRAVCQIIDLL